MLEYGEAKNLLESPIPVFREQQNATWNANSNSQLPTPVSLLSSSLNSPVGTQNSNNNDSNESTDSNDVMTIVVRKKPRCDEASKCIYIKQKEKSDTMQMLSKSFGIAIKDITAVCLDDCGICRKIYTPVYASDECSVMTELCSMLCIRDDRVTWLRIAQLNFDDDEDECRMIVKMTEECFKKALEDNQPMTIEVFRVPDNIWAVIFEY